MGKIRFEEASHRYIDESGKDLISVSKLVSKYKQPQDWAAIAKKSAAKQSKETGQAISGPELQAQWKAKGARAAEVGTKYHLMRETQALNGDEKFYGKTCERKQCEHKDGAKFSIPINDIANNTAYLELMIYDIESMVCGQSDKVIVADNKIHIWDYKTDKELKFKGYSNEWMKARRYLPPLDHLEECNGNEYAIKMSLYMYMLWKANKGRFQPGEIIIEHIIMERDENGEPVVDEQGFPHVIRVDKHKLPYLKKEAIALLKAAKK